MAIWQKILLGLFLTGVLILGLAATLVHLYVTPERVQSLVQEGLENSLKRKVNLGAVNVGLFSGIKLEKLTIHAKRQDDILFSADNIELAYDFSALLHGELLLSKILIKDPHLRLVRQADGHLNISDLLGNRGTEQQTTAAAAKGEAEKSAGAIPLRVKQFSLQGGTLLFIDRKMNEKSPYRYRLDGLSIDVQNFSLDKTFPIKLAAKLNGSPLALDLQFGLIDGVKSLQLKSTQLNLVPFLPYFQERLPGSLERGLLSTELVVQKQPQGFSVKGQTVVEQLDVSLNLEKPLHWNKVRIALDQNLFFRPSDEVLEVKKLAVDIDGVQVAYLGKILLSETAHVAGEADFKIADLRKISALLPQETRQQAAVYGIAGKVEVHLQLSGPATSIAVVQQATLKADGLQASIAGLRPALNGNFNYSAGQLHGEQIDIDLKGQHVKIDLDAAQIFSAVPRLKLKVTSDTINVDELFPRATTEEVRGAEASTAKFSSRTSSAPHQPPAEKTSIVPEHPRKIPVTASLDLLVRQFKYQGLLFENIQAFALLQDGLLHIKSLTADTTEGDVALSAEAELKQRAIPVQGNFKIHNINLSRLTDVLLPEGKGSTSGSLTAQGQFSSSALENDPLANLTSQGEFDLRDGEIKGSPLLKELSSFLTNPEFELVGFNRFQGRYGLKKGQGTIEAKLESRRITLAPKGTFTLEGKLNLTLETRISPEVMAKAGIGGKGGDLLKDDEGWSLLPLKVKGTYSKPRFSLDSKGVRKQLKKSVINELDRQIQKKLGGGSDDPKNQQLQQLLNGTLKKLFGN